VRADEPPAEVTDRFRANIFWMGRAPLVPGRRYVLRIGAARVPMELESVLGVLDASELTTDTAATSVERHGVAEVVLRCLRSVAFDPSSALEPTSRFVIVSGYDIAGCGTVIEALAPRSRSEHEVRGFASGLVTADERAQRNGHRGQAVFVIGDSAADAEDVAARIERRLFDLYAKAYYLGATDVADQTGVLEREERLVHLGVIARAMADNGVVLVVALGDIDRFDLERIKETAAPHKSFVIARVASEAEPQVDVCLPLNLGPVDAADAAIRHLAAAGVLPEYEI